MAPSTEHDLADATEAVRLRRQQASFRWFAAAAAAAMAIPIIGWLAGAIWLTVFAATQITEHMVARPVLNGQPMSATRMKLTELTLIASGLSFSALSVIYWRVDGPASGAVATLVILGALMNALLICQASRRLFLALVAPSFFYLAMVPVLELLARSDLPHVLPTAAGVVLAIATSLRLWRHIDGVHRQELTARRALQGSVRALEEQTAAKSQFVAMVGHELRTPISGVLAASGALERHADPAVREHARMIAEGGRMMRTVLNDLLDLAKIEAGRMAVEQTRFDLRDVIDQTARFWTAEAEAKGLDLGVSGAERLPRAVEGDPTRLRQILNNLLSNAVKFTSTGAVSILCNVGDDSTGQPVVRIAVSDSGPGLSAERLAKLFTPFTQADASVARLHGGTGLGLAISRQLARLMDGELEADSHLGAGSTFTLKLPLKVVAAAPGPARVASCATTHPEGLCVLIADDHQINRRAMRLLLTPLQPRVVEAKDGGEALAALAAEAFDVVLMDVNMPDMSGHEVVRRLRAAEGPNRHTPVLAVTASTEAADVRECLMAGMNGFVAKPIEARELLEAVMAAAAGEADALADGRRAAA